jgi:hypothetical protein
MESWEEFDGGKPRAPRFQLEFPLQYRPRGATAWHSGRDANISRSGLLFLAEQPLPAGSPVEVSFVIPLRIPGERSATVICQGHVVRQVVPDDSRYWVKVAVTIEEYRFLRQHGH